MGHVSDILHLPPPSRPGKNREKGKDLRERNLREDHCVVREVEVRKPLVRERHPADPPPDCAPHNVVHTSAEQ